MDRTRRLIGARVSDSAGQVEPAGATFQLKHHTKLGLPPSRGKGLEHVLVALIAGRMESSSSAFARTLSSWLDRMAMGVFVANLLRLPKLFPGLYFVIEHGVEEEHASMGL